MNELKETSELNINNILPSTEIKGDDGVDYIAYVEDTIGYTDRAFGYAPVLDEDKVSLFQIMTDGEKNDPANAEKLSKLPFGDESFLKNLMTLGKDLRAYVEIDIEKGEMRKWSKTFKVDGEKYVLTYTPDIEGPINPYENYLKRLSSRR